MQKQEEKHMVRICGQVLPEEVSKLKETESNNFPTRIIQQPVNLIIGIPTHQSVDIEWSNYYSHNLLPKMVPPNTGVILENRYGVAQSRETIANTFMRNPNATHLLFYDTDIIPNDSHAITTLINDTMLDQSKYIVSGCYYNSLYTGLNAWINEVAINPKDPNSIFNTSPDPLIPVDKIGMGICMIRKDLFRLLVMEERPLFFYKIQEGNVMQSEDFVFFDKLAKYGIRPYIDTRVKCDHIKRCKVGFDGSIKF